MQKFIAIRLHIYKIKYRTCICAHGTARQKKPFILQTVERGIWKNGILYISNISLRNDLVQQLVSFSGLIYLNTSNMNILILKQLICNMKK